MTDIRGTGPTTQVYIRVVNRNDPPAVANPIEDQFLVARSADVGCNDVNAEFSFRCPKARFDIGNSPMVDPPVEPLSYLPARLTNAADLLWLNFDSKPAYSVDIREDIGIVPIQVIVTDGEFQAWTVFTIFVLRSLDAPVLEAPIDDISHLEGADFVFEYPEDAFRPFRDDDVLTYSARLTNNGAPLDETGWLSFDPETRTFTGTPGDEHVRFWNITVSAHDANTEGVGPPMTSTPKSSTSTMRPQWWAPSRLKRHKKMSPTS